MTKGLVSLFAMIIMGLVFSLPAAAQENVPLPGVSPAIQQMRLQVLPEYDDPRVLVIAQGRLASTDGSYNAPITFRLPAGAQINQMAVLDLTLGNPQSLPFETQPDPADPAWMLVTYTLTNPHFFYEYYYNPLAGGSQKQFTFTFKSIDDIETLSLEIQQPLKAESFTLEPPAASSRSDTAGFTYWQYPDRPVTAGEEIEVVARYTKTDPNPSVVRPETTAGPPTSPAPAGSSSLPDSSWIGLTVVGVVLVVAFGFIRHRFQANRPAQAVLLDRGHSPKPALPQADISSAPAEKHLEARFCTGCGQTLPRQAVFCPYCGREVRK